MTRTQAGVRSRGNLVMTTVYMEKVSNSSAVSLRGQITGDFQYFVLFHLFSTSRLSFQEQVKIFAMKFWGPCTGWWPCGRLWDHTGAGRRLRGRHRGFRRGGVPLSWKSRVGGLAKPGQTASPSHGKVRRKPCVVWGRNTKTRREPLVDEKTFISDTCVDCSLLQSGVLERVGRGEGGRAGFEHSEGVDEGPAGPGRNASHQVRSLQSRWDPRAGPCRMHLYVQSSHGPNRQDSASAHTEGARSPAPALSCGWMTVQMTFALPSPWVDCH